MDHRDRGRGELARHEWQDSGGRSDPAPSWPADPYSRSDVTYRTPSRRRARHRGAPEPVDSYTPSWARESTEPLQPNASAAYPDTSGTYTSGAYTGAFGWATDATDRSPDSGLDPRDGGRHHRPDRPDEPVSDHSGRQRVAPEVTWDSTGEYWRGPSGTAGDAPGAESSGDRWRGTGDPVGWRGEPSGSTWRDTTGRTPHDAAGTSPGGMTGSTPDDLTDSRATGRRGRRRGAADQRPNEVDDWASAAPTSGWVGTAPTTGAGAGAPARGWISEAPTSGGWAAAAPTTGAGANSGLLGDPPPMSGAGRRRRADPDDDPTAAPTSGWGVGATGSPSTGTARRDLAGTAAGRADRVDDPVSARWGRVDDPASGRWGRAGEREPDPAYDPTPPVPGRRRRAEPAGWESGGPDDRVTPVGRRRSRHRAEEESTQPVEQPDAVPSTEPEPGTEQSRSGARWVRSSGQTGSGGGTGRRRRSEDPLPGPAGTVDRRLQREPDAEPVRRSRDAGPVRGAGQERAERGRHTDSGWGQRSDASGAGWGTTDAGPWDRFTDTGMLDRVTDTEPPGVTGTSRRRDRSPDPGRWDRSTDTGQWDRTADTGQWDRFTDTTEWRHGELAGLAGDAGSGRDTGTGTGGRDTGADGDTRDSGRTGSHGGDTFWSGTRLAGDDPRWMGIPDSAPRSPAVAYPPPARPVSPARQPRQPSTSTGRSAAAPARGRTAAGRGTTVSSARSVSGAGTTTRRAPSSGLLTSATRTGRPSPLSRRLEDDLLDPQPSGPLTAVLYTVAWYAVAVLAIFVWVLTLDASVPVDCVPEISGSCESERGQAISALVAGVPRFLAALATGLVVAALMRWFNRTWRAVTVGFAAAVVGGGLSTVFFSALSGQPVG